MPNHVCVPGIPTDSSIINLLIKGAVKKLLWPGQPGKVNFREWNK